MKWKKPNTLHFTMNKFYTSIKTIVIYWFFTIPFYFSQLCLTNRNWEIISFPRRFQGGGGNGNDDFTFQKFFFLKITKQHMASLISTLNTGEPNKIKLTNYFILRMRVFIQNFTYIEKGVKCRGKKFTYPKC